MMAIPDQDFEAELHWKFVPLYEPCRFKIARGGRAGMKSHAIAEALLFQGMDKSLRIICTREHQVSINDSVLRLLADKIDRYQLHSNYEVKSTSIVSRTNDTEFAFKGLRHNIGNVKSLEGFDICWVEEAAYVPEHSWKVLIPTMRKAGSEIWASYNPDAEDDPIHLMANSGRPDMVVIDSNYTDNEWASDEIIAEAEIMRENDIEAYNHVWGGMVRTHTDSQIFAGQYAVEPFDPQPYWNGPYYGADWGFATDPNVLVKCWIGDNHLWIEREAWGRKTEMEKLPDLFAEIPGSNKHTIRGDNARPETINYLQRNGYPRLTAAKKWPGSVEDGIEYIRGNFKKVIIHTRCKHTRDEFRLYSNKVDKLTGDVMTGIVDAHNHCIDSIRYALQPAIRARRPAQSGTTHGM